VRAACVAALTELADSPAPAPLLDALSDAHPVVVLQGIFALSYFPDRSAIEPLCRFVESDVPVLYRESAMSHLGQLGNPRAIPALLKALHHPSHELEQTYSTAAIALGRLGALAVDALIEALRSPDARVRFAAVCGLQVAMDRRAIPHLRESATDPDQRTRDRAATVLTFLER
jgi:HEAT repeat protein